MPNVLGVDPGSYTTGWSLVEGAGRLPRLVECGEIRLATRLSFPERLHLLRSEFEAIVCRLLPDAAAVEAPLHGPSARAALQLAHARGVSLAVLAGRSVPISEYSPATVKKAVTGSGRAGKEQVQAMVGRLLGAPLDPSAGTDLSDATAVALCSSLASVVFFSAFVHLEANGIPTMTSGIIAQGIAGGVVGETIAEGLRTVFAGTGAHIVIIAGFLVSLLLSAPLSLGEAVRRIPQSWAIVREGAVALIPERSMDVEKTVSNRRVRGKSAP